MTYSAPFRATAIPQPQNRATRTESADTRAFVFLLLDQFTQLAFSCAIEPLRLANHVAGRPLYAWRTASETGAPVRASNGICILVDGPARALGPRETLIVVGGRTPRDAVGPGLAGYLRRQQAHGVRLISVCGATAVLARAGIIQAQTCAVHWEMIDALAETHPDLEIVDGTFALDKVATAAGGAAAADLVLHLIGQDHGHDFAARVADLMVYSGLRGPLAPQTPTAQARFGRHSRTLAAALKLMETHLQEPLAMRDLSHRVGLSVRQIERLFLRHLGESPNRHYMALRMRRARNLLTQTDMAVTDVALACGFTSLSHFSKKYRLHFGQTAVRDRAAV